MNTQTRPTCHLANLSCILFAALSPVLLARPLWAQSITPAADGTGTIIEYNGNTYTITGGTNAGANLFHSFQQFGLQPSEIADFLSNPAIQNVVGRVVGGDPSVIEGLIRLSGGNSNLFLVNPAGWVFTAGASVDVPGSFGVSTATRIGFGSEFFNAVGDNNYAALTGDPTSLIFDSAQPGAIINDADLNVDGNLWLVGGSVISTGSITAPTGTVTLAAVPGESRVKLTHEGMALGLVLDALPAEEVQAGMPLGLAVADLGRYLTGGSHIGNAGNFVVTADGSIHLVGSESRVEAGQVVIGDRITAENVDLIAGDRVQVSDPTLVQGDTTVVRLPGAEGSNTLSVIDSRADNPYFLLYGGAQGTISRIISRDEDGVDIISTELAEIAEQGDQVDAVSITAEGHEGNFWLGNAWITHESVQDYQTQLASWGQALTESADLLLYSCFTALGDTGAALMNSLANLTGADVAASVNATGSANYDGDWVLESSTGSIEAGNPFAAATIDAWDGKLATLTVTTLSNTGAGSLRERIQTDASFGDLITFSVSGTITLDGTTAGTDGEIDLNDNYLTIDGNSNITIDGNGNSRIFDIGDGVSNITIQNITLQNGSAGGDGGAIRKDRANAYIQMNLINVTGRNNVASSDGGFMQLGTSHVNIINSTITGNSVTGNKGGAFDIEDNGSFYITNSTISNNSAPSRGSIAYLDESVTLVINNSTITGNTTGDDGAWYVDEDANVRISNSVISNNSATREGGFLWADDFSDIVITNSTITGNSARDGGAIHADDFDSTNVTIVNSTLSGNYATQEGGAIFLGSNGVANIIGSTLSGNSAGQEGGAIYGDNDVIVNVIRSTLSGNSAGRDGGAIYVDDLGSIVNVINSTISGNTSAQDGGGIYADRAPVNLINSTVAFNSAGYNGGGIFVNQTYAHTIFNSIISNNTDAGSNSPDISANLSTSDVRHSLILNTTGITGTVLSTGVNGNIIGQDPLLQPLAFNGGSSTQTHALDFNSPAINAGSNELISNLALTTDQSGIFARIFGGTVDIGAYEVNPDYQLSPFSFAEVYLDPLERTGQLVDGAVSGNACQGVPEIDLGSKAVSEQKNKDELKDATSEVGLLDEDCNPIGI
ncbi:MAG: DUF4347 domain-containing protein [Spirulinaceae cyanobacterium]